MIKYAGLFLAFFSWQGISSSDKSVHCPDVEDVQIIVRGEPNYYIYRALNNDGKLFQSAVYGGQRDNGPAPALHFYRAEYDQETKELRCIYTAYSVYGFPVLVNTGDY